MKRESLLRVGGSVVSNIIKITPWIAALYFICQSNSIRYFDLLEDSLKANEIFDNPPPIFFNCDEISISLS